MAGRIRVQVLGTPRVLLDDVEAKVGARSTLLLLRLVVARPATIDRDRLRNDVWWDTEGSDGALRVQVNRVRAALGRDVIVSNADGYRIGAEVAVDAERFERLCVAGRDRSLPLDTRAAILTEGTELWRGDAYSGVEHVTWIRNEVTRLGELRALAVDERFELLSLIEPPEHLVAELRAAVDDEPTREQRVAARSTSSSSRPTTSSSARASIDACAPMCSGSRRGWQPPKTLCSPS